MSHLHGSLELPAQRSFEREQRKIAYENLRDRLRQRFAPGVLYRGMLHWFKRSGMKEQRAFFCFSDMFGGKPREADRGEPLYLADVDFEEWMMLWTEHSRREWQRVKAKRRRKNDSTGQL